MSDRVAALITHGHPPATTDAVTLAISAAREAGWRLVATAGELAKHGDAADHIETVEELPRQADLCLVLGGDGSILYALRHFARSGVPVFGVNFGTVGFLAAVERDEADDGMRRAFAGETEASTFPASRSRWTAIAGGPQRRQLHPPPARAGRRAELQDRRRGGRPRPLRRPRRRDAGRFDRLQPRQPGPDPCLGGEGLRRLLRRPALADRARPRGRSR